MQTQTAVILVLFPRYMDIHINKDSL